MLARLMGQVLMVVEAKRTARSAVEESVALLEDCQKVSLLLNKTERSQTGAYGYGYGYGYSGRYGGKYTQNYGVTADDRGDYIDEREDRLDSRMCSNGHRKSDHERGMLRHRQARLH